MHLLWEAYIGINLCQELEIWCVYNNSDLINIPVYTCKSTAVGTYIVAMIIPEYRFVN